jgi:pimeloyl-ACP methyl ester carboxylesterase
MIRHDHVPVAGTVLHVARTGDGPPLLLVHGWPELWLTWEPVMARLADRFTLIAPDLRGFGASPLAPGELADPPGSARHAADLVALLDGLGLARVGFVGHDIGGFVGQALARAAPARLSRLFFFDCPYPGIGGRWIEPGHLRETWYQSFHQLPLAPRLIGASRDTLEIYLRHFLTHWAARRDAFAAEGVLESSLAWYRGVAAERAQAIGGAAPPPPIDLPTAVRWPGADPLFPRQWTDRLGLTFADLDLEILEGVGHFPHREDPERAAALIAAWFSR